MPSVLLITYEFPPKGGPGVQRPLKTAKYLSRMGWDVTVLTVKDPLGGMMDDTLLAELPPEVRVERAWSLEPTRLVAALRRLKGARRADGGAGVASGTRGYTSLPHGAIRFVQAFFVPDEKVGWTPWAVAAARRVHAEAPVDVILASGPPFSAYGVAWRVSRRLGVPWVADVRDPIVGGYFFRPPTPVHDWAMRRYEQKVVHRAHAIVTVTDGIGSGIAQRSPAGRMPLVTIPNGFDPDDFEDLAREPHAGFVLAYVGTFQGTIQPRTLLAAVKSLESRGSSVVRDLRIRFVGVQDPESSEAVRSYGLEGFVERTGYVDHAEAIREMAAADVLLLVLGPEAESSAILTGKLPEYLAAGRPVLALVPEGVAADVVQRTGAGEVVHPEDVEAAAQALERLHSKWLSGGLPEPNPEVVSEFDRSRQVARVSEMLEQVVGSG